MSMLEEKYSSESWVRVYTDGSTTNATTKGGAGIYIQYPNGEQQSEAQAYTVPTTKLKGKPSFMLHIPSSAKLITTFKLYS